MTAPHHAALTRALMAHYAWRRLCAPKGMDGFGIPPIERYLRQSAVRYWLRRDVSA